ncbi:MAG: 4-hydroxy-tetrahydrodipicolinate reductase [Spirochaetales bacterium]|nr:4-hydroxy-tetrahydrodipicolinate reductase [Spirochaetales bacterium]
MKAIIIGYGRMGKEIEQILLQRQHEVVARIDAVPGVGDYTEISEEILKKADFAIEFALPTNIEENARIYANAQTPVVIGTTGWDNIRQDIAKIFEEKGTCMWGSNFSIGAHMLFKLTEKMASFYENIPGYDIMVNEYHHKFKKDSPSGTAITIGEKILNNTTKKKSIITDRLDRQIKDEELHVASVRGGMIPGIHTVTLDSEADTIELTHNARSRQGFALGAVLAAEWLANKKGFYRVEDFINEVLN